MPTIDPADEPYLDGPNHKATWFFSPYMPRVLLSAQIAGTPVRYLFSYDNGTSDDFAAIEEGYTLLIGTAPGLEDIGRARLRSISGTATSGTIKVSANSFAWADNQYITIIELPEICEKTPYIDDNGVFFKDDDIPYVDQNYKPNPIPIMGRDRAGRIGPSGLITFALDGSASYSAKAGVTITSCLWSCTGGTIAAPTSLTTTIDFTTPGHYVLKLTVTDSNGKSKKGFRLYVVHDGNSGGLNYPMAYRLDSPPTGDRGGGGFSFGITLTDIGAVQEGTLAILWQEMWFGAERREISFRGETVCLGYIREIVSSQNWSDHEVKLSVVTPEQYVQNIEIWSASLTYVALPDYWYEIGYATTAGVLHHYIEWHSTLFDVKDVFLPTGHTGQRSFDDIDGGKLIQVIEMLAGERGIMAHLMSNAAGQIRVYQDLQLLNTAGRAGVAAIADITPRRYVGELNITRNSQKVTSYVHLEGFSKNAPVRSKAPGDIPYRTGDRVQKTGQVFTSDLEGRERAGRILAAANNPYRDIRVRFNGNWSGIVDISPQEWWTANFTAWENGLSERWVNVKMFCKSVTYTYAPDSGTVTVDAVFEREAFGPDGVDDPYPGNLPNPGGAVVTYETGSISTIYPSSQGVYIMSPTDGGWSQDVGLAMKWIIADPYWQVNRGSNDYSERVTWLCGLGAIYRREYSDFIGWQYSQRMPADNPPNSWGDAPAPTKSNLTYIIIEGGSNDNGTFVCVANWQNGASAWRSWLLFTNDAGANWQWISLI